VNFGQYAHSNQPVHHVLYLFSVAGRRNRTQYWVHRVLNELYTLNTFAGDEDTGSMGAWYVLGALGLFSHCPGKSEWTLGAPRFSEAVLSYPSGRAIRITAKQKSADSYLKNVTVNGAKHEGNYISHSVLAAGCSIVFSD
jgi:putative alpha-1,2-mannosidase